MNKETVKMLLESDCEVLAKAYKSDGELLEMINKTITQHVSSIYNALVVKGIITEEEVLLQYADKGAISEDIDDYDERQAYVKKCENSIFC